MESFPGLLTELPEHVLYRVLHQLDCPSLASLSCVCKELDRRASREFLWKSACEQRWQTHDTDLWRRSEKTGSFKRLYGEKDKLDKMARAQTLRLGGTVEEFRAALRIIYRLGRDVEDVLREDANADSTSLQAKWAREALLHVQARRASNTLCSLVYRSGLSHEAYLDEGAMLLARCHYPLSDLSAIERWFDAMAAELQRRMKAAEVTGGDAALKLLSELLFDQTPDEDDGGRYDHWKQLEATEIRTWGAREEAFLKVPDDGSSFNLRGNREEYGDPGNSLIPSVLLTGRGIPLTLCIIHAAVGRRAGLDISGVNLPIHFVNKFVDGDLERYVDCFHRGRILTREQLPLSLGPEIYLRFQLGTDERIFNPALPRDVWIRAISNMQNAYTGNLLTADEQPPRGLVLCNLLMCGVLRTFTRQPYFVQQELVTEYVKTTWDDWTDLLPWVLPGSLSLAHRHISESLR